MTDQADFCIDRRLLSRVRNKISKRKDHNQGLLDPEIVTAARQFEKLAAIIAENGSRTKMLGVVRGGIAKAFPTHASTSTEELETRLREIGAQMLTLPTLDDDPRQAIRKFCEYISSTPPDRPIN